MLTPRQHRASIIIMIQAEWLFGARQSRVPPTNLRKAELASAKTHA